MIRSRAPLAAAVALAAALLACTKTAAPVAGARFLQPEDLAVFVGRTIQDPANLLPYTVVANATRNDLSLVDGVTDVAIPAPIKLQTLVIPLPGRPARLAAASLGDGKADLLVAASGGDSVLQLVETWNAANAVHSDPAEAPARAVDLGSDVVALAALPPDPDAPGTARIAAVLAESRVAVVTYVRGGDGQSIQLGGAPAVSAPLAFQPLAIAAMPDDPDVAGLQTALYVATRDEVAPGLFGAAEISLDLSTVRPLGARAPTRLVAAARLQERFQPDPATASVADLARSAASDGAAFTGQPLVPRVYAVLDESGCGFSKPIDCGIVVLDPALAGGEAIPPDYGGLMPYRAPMRLPGGRAVRIVASGPPKVAPPKVVEAEPDYVNGLMRIYMGATYRATTGAAAVAADNGFVYFFDLGRFELETTQPVVQIMGTGWPTGGYVSKQRLWLQKLGGSDFAPDTDPANATDAGAASAYITVTPGFTTDEGWSVTWQGVLPDLVLRAAEAGPLVAGPPAQPWIAFQVGDGPLGPTRIVNDVVQLWHPALAIHPKTSTTSGDILVIKAAGMPSGCVGTNPPGTAATADPSTIEKEFELRITAVVAPTADYPGGALAVAPPPSSDPPEWTACYDALASAATGTSVWTGLRVTVRAEGLVLVGGKAGYAGRPPLDTSTGNGTPYQLTYLVKDPGGALLDEDALAAACPLADWDGSLGAPVASQPCDAACRETCEQLVLARKARRYLNVSVDCSTNAATTATCQALWPNNTFPIANGPVLGLQVGVQISSGGSTVPARDLAVLLSTSSGVLPLFARGTSTAPFQASGMVAFDRSPWSDVAGYRFLVSYPENFALDTTPSQWPPPSVVIH